MSNINWLDGSSQISTHFTVKDMIFLPQWGRLASDEDGLTEEVKDNLINLCAKLEVVRKFLGDIPFISHCGFRPAAYNQLVGGAKSSAHLTGQALDFHVQGHDSTNGCNDIRNLIKDHLEDFDLRMENNTTVGGANWVHLDSRDVAPGGHRYFIP